MASAHDFTFSTLKGEPLPLKSLAGTPILIVNTASKCGFTPQYKGLEALWGAYRARGLTVIGVPCNDFGNQEPGGSAEIGQFCELNYGVSFPITQKEHAKGARAHPFFNWVAQERGFWARPKWNFFKFLIRKDGALADWYSSFAKPESAKIKAAIERTLAE